MSDPATYNRFVLKFETPYARRGGANQLWQLKFAMSGDDLTSSADAEATAEDLAAPVLGLVTTETSWTGWLYYKHGSTVNDYNADYDYGVNPGTAAAYATGGGKSTQLEVCMIAKARVGTSSKGKAVYLMKHIHDVVEASGGPGFLEEVTAGTLDAWSTGCGPNNLVTVSPSTGDLSDAWTWDTALYTRQLRRGFIPKA